MSKGVILFAHNSTTVNYYTMAEYTAKRVEHFLNLPVSLITDENSLPDNPKYNFNDIILIDPDISNKRNSETWINKGRFQAYEFSPYDETIVLDVDYCINSDKLLQLFSFNRDFLCHKNTSFLTDIDAQQELLSWYNIETLWATVIYFKKSTLAKNVFEIIQMVQQNYTHYQNIHRFMEQMYRNDYALTLALRIANGHKLMNDSFIPWNLLHVPSNTKIQKITNEYYNTKYNLIFETMKNGKIKKEYIEVNDIDFHVLNKNSFTKLYE